MALTENYLMTTKNLQDIINSVINAKAPVRFTQKFLEDLGFKSTSDRLYIGLFKSLGMLDDSGAPMERYYKFIDQTETNRILALGIQEAYEDLFNLRKDAQNLTVDEAKNKLKTLTQGQKSDKVLTLMAKTFKSLCEIADWTKLSSVKKRTQEDKTKKISPVEHDSQQKSDIIKVIDSENMNLHYNIQIHLPETTNMTVYDAIFQSLKKHLF